MDIKQIFTPIFSDTLTRSLTEKFNGFGLSGAVTKSGKPVTVNTALHLSAFYNAIEIIGNDYAKLPKSVYKKTDTGREKQSRHPVQYLISTRPNALMSAFAFDKALIQHAILKGNGYAEIIRQPNTAGIETFNLINQDDTEVTVKLYKGKLYYEFDGRIVEAENMIHIPGFSFNGIVGISVIKHAAQSMGINLSSQEAATEYYNSKGIGTGVVTVSTDMDNDAKVKYGNAISQMFESKKAWNIPVIDEASKFEHIKITPQEAQFIETQKQGVEEVARWLNIPPHKIKSLQNVNNSITENQEIQHISDSILPWAIKFEQEYNEKSFNQIERDQDYYIKANVNALLRADTKTRADYLKTAVNFGWLSRNEVRELEDLNTVPELGEYLIPANLQTLKQVEKNLNKTDAKNTK